MNFKKSLSEFGTYIMLGIIFLGCIILYAGLGTRANSPNIYFIIIGILILLPFAIYLIYDKVKLLKSKEKQRLELAQFKKSANKIFVNLDDLTIKSNTWNKTVVTDRTQYAGFNALTGNVERNIKSITVNSNSVKVKIPYRGKIVEYNVSVPMDTIKLKIHFSIKKETILYIDPADEKRMYLDLEFLE